MDLVTKPPFECSSCGPNETAAPEIQMGVNQDKKIMFSDTAEKSFHEVDIREKNENESRDNDTMPKSELCCPPYEGHREALAWAFDSAPRGAILMGGAVFVNTALLHLAKVAAGCETEPREGETVVRECNGRVYGMRPSSLLTLILTVVGVLAASSMPFVGALIDHTRYRRLVGRATAVVIIFLVLGETFISQKNWFAMTILQVGVAFTYCLHVVVTFAYLPELTSDKKKLVRWTASFTMCQYSSMVIFLSFMVVASKFLGIANDSVATARISQMVVFIFSTIFFGISWLRLFTERPASQKVPQGSNLFTAGFKKFGKTAKEIGTKNASLKWFLISVSLTESALSTFNTLAITYMTEYLQFNSTENGISILILLLSSIPGSRISAFVSNTFDPLRSLQVVLVIWIITNGLAALILVGPGKQVECYILCSIWGVATGWVYSTERAAYCTIIPKGQEAGLMGVYFFACSILAWLPPLVFTAMNEAGVDMRLSFVSIDIFFSLSLCAQFMIGGYEKAVVRAETSGELTQEEVGIDRSL